MFFFSEAEGNVDKVTEMLMNNPRNIVLGNKEAKNMIIEFFDYSCGYCKKQAAELQKIITEKGSDVKLLLVDLPMLSENSVFASRASGLVKAKKPESFASFYFALMGSPDAETSTVVAVAAKLGLSKQEVETAMKSQDADAELFRDNQQAFMMLAGKGAPLVIVNGKIFNGFVSAEQIMEAMQ